MTSCPACHVELVGDANFCTSCGSSLREDMPASAFPVAPDPVAIDLVPAEDEAPTQVFDIPAGPPSVAATAAMLDVELVTCATCDAPNAAQRGRCGRCDAELDVEPVPALFAPQADETPPVTIDEEPTPPPVTDVRIDEDPTPPPGRRDDDQPTVPPHEAPSSPVWLGDDDTLPPVRDATFRTPLVPALSRSDASDGPRDPTGRLPVIDRTVRRPETEDARGAATPQASPRWPVVAAVVVAVLAGGGLGFAIATGGVPFGGDRGSEFAAAEYPDPPQTLGMTSASATSSRTDAPPSAAVDQDAMTAWVADADDAVPALTVDLGQPAWLTDVVIATGEPSTIGGPAGSGRVTMAFLDIDGERVASLVLRDQPGDQRIRLVTPALADQVTITVADLGDTGPAAITELRLEGHALDVEGAATRS